MIDRDFCNNLLKIRTQRGVTQPELAALSKVPVTSISKYENGAREPHLSNIKALCKGLGCTATELLGV